LANVELFVSELNSGFMAEIDAVYALSDVLLSDDSLRLGASGLVSRAYDKRY
jgi:hypothetical protein